MKKEQAFCAENIEDPEEREAFEERIKSNMQGEMRDMLEEFAGFVGSEICRCNGECPLKQR